MQIWLQHGPNLDKSLKLHTSVSVSFKMGVIVAHKTVRSEDGAAGTVPSRGEQEMP